MSDTPEFMTHERIMTGEEYVSYSDYLSLQRERDEAIAERDILKLDAQREAEHHDRMVGELEKVYKERDEARAELSLKCQSVTIASGTISDLLKESERLEKQIEGLNNFANERFDEIQRVRRERDEAREQNARARAIISQSNRDYDEQIELFRAQNARLRAELDELKEGAK
jgi:chromosome segregation ATPase